MKELWVDIYGYENYYQISNKGRVRSLDRTVNTRGGTRVVKGKILSNNKTNGNGYRIVALSKNGNVKNKYIHRLVAESFIPNCEHFSEVNHINGDKSDNCVLNLEWCSRIHNLLHALNTGLTSVGESSCKSKLTDKQAEEVYLLAKKEEISQIKIAELYNISQQTVSDIKIGKYRKYDKWRKVKKT